MAKYLQVFKCIKFIYNVFSIRGWSDRYSCCKSGHSRRWHVTVSWLLSHSEIGNKNSPSLKWNKWKKLSQLIYTYIYIHQAAIFNSRFRINHYLKNSDKLTSAAESIWSFSYKVIQGHITSRSIRCSFKAYLKGINSSLTMILSITTRILVFMPSLPISSDHFLIFHREPLLTKCII